MAVFTTQRLTGVQRYAFEVTRRFPSSAIRVVSPRPIAAEYKFLENVTIVDQYGKFAHKVRAFMGAICLA